MQCVEPRQRRRIQATREIVDVEVKEEGAVIAGKKLFEKKD